MRKYLHLLGISLLLCVLEVFVLTGLIYQWQWARDLLRSSWLYLMFVFNYLLPLFFIFKQSIKGSGWRDFLLITALLVVSLVLQFVVGFFSYCLQGFCV